jgi:hypothetical protein
MAAVELDRLATPLDLGPMQGMTPSANKRHQMERERLEREARELAEHTQLKRDAVKHVMALWNVSLASGWRTIFYPSVGTALATGCHWLHVLCPAYQQMGEADLRAIDIHPNASIGTVVRAMSCKRCSPHPPFAQPLGATRRSWEGRSLWKRERKRSIERVEIYDIGWGQRQIAAKKAKGSE